MARKPKDYRAELEAIQDKARELKARHTVELGRIVQATGADRLDPEVLAGILVAGVRAAEEEKAREAWRSDGASFFRKRERRKAAGTDHGDSQGDPARRSGEAEG
jgi:DNA-binding helix-hairpin-helix protein with protein kinase domain